AALDGGASWLAVALVEEGRQLREAGIDAPILLLSEPAPPAMDEALAADLAVTIYTRAGLDALRGAARPRPGDGRRAGGPRAVQVKVDTGMHRVGAPPAEAAGLARELAGDADLALGGVWTHLAVADEVDDGYTAHQLAIFDRVSAELAAGGIRPPLRHAANSAGALWHPPARYDLVRCGIALYGLAPAAEEAGRAPVPELRPALSLKAQVSHVKEVGAGQRVSYGLRYRLEEASVIATVPLGYADGVTRALGATGGQVLVGGHRRPIAGTVTMDQILVDCGPGSPVRAGDEVVLLGVQGDESIGAWEWAARTGTIAYEVVCGISARVPRRYVDTLREPDEILDIEQDDRTCSGHS
ncbi:MAG: alanine racemase, partial [Acidimicrobiales bacterium]